MMLDSGAEIYIWIGNEANNDEKEKALEIAKVTNMKSIWGYFCFYRVSRFLLCFKRFGEGATIIFNDYVAINLKCATVNVELR